MNILPTIHWQYGTFVFTNIHACSLTLMIRAARLLVTKFFNSSSSPERLSLQLNDANMLALDVLYCTVVIA